MTEIVNPYIAGAPVTEQRMFFGREDIFQWIENSIAGQYADHILVVHGQRRVGKTSVLKQLGNRLPKRFIPVFFDLQGRTHTTLDHFLWWLARETVRVLKQDRDIEVIPPEKQAFSNDPEFFENQFLTSVRSALGKNTLLLTFDEFDNLEESEVKEELARPLVDHLRRLMGQPNLNFIFSIGSSGRKLENMQAAYTDFFKTALYKKISFLNEEQAHKLVTRPVEGIIEYERGAVDRIYGITSGHPYFTQLTCHELFARCQRTEQRKIAKADVEAILDDVVERGTVNLKFVWDEASDIEKWSLSTLAQLDKTDNRTVADYLRKQRVRFSESDLTSGLLRLREKDVLTSENRFVIHLLKIWLQKNRPIEQAREELTEANPIASRFIEIGLEFRDSGQYEKAIEYFRQALSVSSDNLQAQVNIALTYSAQGLLDQAVIEFEKALVMDDEDVASRSGLCEAHLKLGDIAMSRKRIQDAIQSYQRILKINTEHTEARGRMAEISRQRAEKALTDGRDDQALSAFAEALKFTPEDQSLIERMEKVQAEKKAKVLAALLARSEKEANAKSWEKSLATLNEALEVAPQDKSILAKITSVKAKQLKEQLDSILIKADQAEKSGRWDAAISALGEYLALKPDDAAIQKRLDNLRAAKRSAWLSAVHTRADAAVASERWDEAIVALNEVLSLEPGNAEFAGKMEQVRAAQKTAELKAILRRAEQAALAGHWDEAVTALNAGLAAEPENEILKVKLVEVRKSRREARLMAALHLADSAAQAGKWDTAAASLQEVLANEPDNAEFLEKLAEIKRLERESKLNTLRTQAQTFLQAEKFEESLAAWNEYLALEPEDHEKAQAQIEAVKKAQTLASLYSEATRVYAKKNYEKAIDLFKRIVVEDAEYKDATDLLAESVRLRRSAHKAPRVFNRKAWFTTGGLVTVLVLGIGGSLFWLGKNGLPAMPSLFTSNTAAPASTATRTAPTVTATPALDPAIQAALDTIQNEEPLYQTNFDDWDSDDTGRNATIVNRKLTLTSKDEIGATLGLNAYPSDSYAVEFELSILGDASSDSLCVYESGNNSPFEDESRRAFSAEFWPGESLAVWSSYVHQLGGHERIATASFDKSRSNVVRLVVLGDQITAFINGQLAYTAQDPAGSAVYFGHGLSAYNQVTCEFDYFKYWDLRDMDSAVKTALAAIQNDEPLYQTSFDAWEFGEPENNAKIENGKLLVTSENDEHAGANVYNLASDRFAVEFELRILDSSPIGHCIFGTTNDYDEANRKSKRALSLGFWLDGSSFLSPYFYQLDDHVDIATSAFDVSKPNTVRLIILREQYTVFFNGQLAYTATDPGGSAFYTRQALSANYTAQCEYDNFKIWDLRGLDPATLTALAAIQSEEPLYQTSFDTWDFGDPVENARVENGKLIVTGGLGQSTYVPLDRSNFSSDRFAVEFEQQILEPSQGAACIFNIAGNNERSLRAVFPLSDMSRIDHPVVPGVGNDLIIGAFKIDPSSSNTVTIIVLNDQISAFVNGQLAFTALDREGSAVYNNVQFEADFQMTCEFDNYKFWDLSGVDFSSSAGTSVVTPTATATAIPITTPNASLPAWVTEFAEPILATIAGQTPHVQDDFETATNSWLTQTEDCDSGSRRFERVDGELVVSKCNFSWKMWYTDFVIEMDYRFLAVNDVAVNDDRWTFTFRGTESFSFPSSGEMFLRTNQKVVGLPYTLRPDNLPKHVLIIVKDQAVALFINDEPVYYGNLPAGFKNGEANWFSYGPTMAYDNFKIWNINDLP